MKALVVALLLSSCGFASDVTRGNQVDAVIRDSNPLYEDSEVCARVDEIGQKVVAASGNRHGFSFRFYVLNSPDVTTFSAPGGAVYVTTGLLRRLQSEDELAVMLGHEIAHVNERHMMTTESSEHAKVVWSRVIIVASEFAGAYAGGAASTYLSKAVGTATTYATQQTSAQLASVTAGVVAWSTASGGLTLLNRYYRGYRDSYEFAADKLATNYATQSGYNGAALVKVLERFSGASSEIGSTEISTLHSSSKALAARTSTAETQTATPPGPNP